MYPEDIENLLSHQQGVKGGVVVGLPKESGSVEVHAALLLETPSQDLASSVVREVNSQLASHQQIQRFTVWPDEDFPRTHTLKVRKPLVIERLQAIGRGEAQQPIAAVETIAVTPLQRLIAEVAGVPPPIVTAEKTLGLDLGLDSLGRVEVLSGIEQELGVYLDETSVGPETTVAELERLLQGSQVQPQLTLPKWPRRSWARALRVVLQNGFVFPALRLLYDVRVRGRENLAALEMPILFAANHSMLLDNAAIVWAIPPAWRRRLAVAAAADDVFGDKFKAFYSSLLGNAFAFSRQGAVRTSLEHLGQLMDDGWNVLIYPEGQLTSFGEIQPFLGGTGLIAVDSAAAIVPIRLKPLKRGWFDGRRGLVRGRAEVVFGKPLTFAPGTPYSEATQRLEAAVRAL